MTFFKSRVKSHTEKWSPSQIEEFKSLAHLESATAGSLVYGEEKPPGFVFLIEAGYIKLYQTTSLGKISTMAIRIPGDLIGISIALLGKNWVCAECIGKCQFWRLEAKLFMKMLHNHPALAVQVATELGRRLYDAQMTIMNLSSLEVDQRLIHLLVNFASSTEATKENNPKINVYLTHQEIATMVGACRQTITTVLGQLKSAEIINIKKRHIEIINLEKLKSIIS